MSIENPKMCVQLIAEWIGAVGEPVKRKDICERFDLDRNDWEVIKRQIESSQDPIKVHGTRKGRKYYVEGVELVTDEEIAEQMYQALYDSEHELRWEDICIAAGIDIEAGKKRSANIQRILKMTHPDFGKGSRRGIWAIEGHHEIPFRRVNFCHNCGAKFGAYIKNYCTDCGEKIRRRGR